MYIFTGPGLASCRCLPLSSNVRHRQNRPPLYSCWLSSPGSSLKTKATQTVYTSRALRQAFWFCMQSVPCSAPAPPRNTQRNPGVHERECPRINFFIASAHHLYLQLAPPRPVTPMREDKLLPRQVGFPHVVVGYLPVATPAVLPVVSTAVPNHSFKPSPNGVPRGPVRRYAVHFRHPGPRVTPLVPA